MGRFMQAHAIVPDLVLCSPARRTRQTLDLVLPFLGPKPEIRFEDDLYPFAPEDVLDCLQRTANGHTHIMLIGHNPGMQSLGSVLAGAGDPALRSELAAKFPTCGLAVLTFEAGWQDLAPSSGTLELFMVPRRLPG
jgi:phosphohistidine phosphatase